MEEQPPEEQPYWIKILLGIIAVGMIVLIITYTIGGSPLTEILRGQIESMPLQGSVIELDEFSIIFEEGTEKRVREYYLEEQKQEFSLCLLGWKDRNYHITSLYQPTMYGQSFSHVSFEPCSPETLIVLHSHPYKSCLASKTDMDTLEKTKERNQDVLMVVMCEPERFSVYG